jgi:hypothetical protein
MANLTITAASVVPVGSSTQRQTGTAGESITAGQAVYVDGADSNKVKLADADVAASAASVGIALHAAATNQPITYATSGPVTIGATPVVGQWYGVSTTAGGIAPLADLATGDFLTILGQCEAAGQLTVKLNVSTVALA